MYLISQSPEIRKNVCLAVRKAMVVELLALLKLRAHQSERCGIYSADFPCAPLCQVPYFPFMSRHFVAGHATCCISDQPRSSASMFADDNWTGCTERFFASHHMWRTSNTTVLSADLSRLCSMVASRQSTSSMYCRQATFGNLMRGKVP